jgi:basic membrane protein A
LLLVQAGATGIRRPVTNAVAECQATFRVAFITDVAGLDSRADAAGWLGVREALHGLPCTHGDLGVPVHPSDYRRLLHAYAGYDLVIAGSFLLTDEAVDIARANPATHVVLVDPLVAPAAMANLAVLVFRDDQAAYLAGALAAMVSQSGVVAGVYGPGGYTDQRNRAGFEHGARYVNAATRVLGAYQPAEDGLPYTNPGWGAAQAKAFVRQGADVIFGDGGSTGRGAVRGAAQAGSGCIGTEVGDDPAAADCLLASTIKHVDRGVALLVADAAMGRWAAGPRTVGLAEAAVELGGLGHKVSIAQLDELRTIAGELAAGELSTGA